MFASMRSLAAASALAAVSLAASAPSASAQASLDLDVDFRLPALVLLRCVDDITLVLDADTLLAAAGVTETTSTEAGAEITESEQQGIFNATGATLPADDFTNLPVVLNSICSIRAIGAGSTVVVDLTLNETQLQDEGNQGTIVVEFLGGRDGGATLLGEGGVGGFTDSRTTGSVEDFEVDVGGGFSQLAYVDVRFDLNLSQANVEGTYSTLNGNDLFTIQVDTN
ncbi:MAG: hypothetical protein AAGI51_12265 [Pseudomonadota bacterium]